MIAPRHLNPELGQKGGGGGTWAMMLLVGVGVVVMAVLGARGLLGGASDGPARCNDALICARLDALEGQNQEAAALVQHGEVGVGGKCTTKDNCADNLDCYSNEGVCSGTKCANDTGICLKDCATIQSATNLVCYENHCNYSASGSCEFSIPLHCEDERAPGPELTPDAIAEQVGTVVGELLAFSMGLSLGIKLTGALVKKISGEIIHAILTKIGTMALGGLDPLGWIGLALDIWDPCGYNTYMSNVDIKTGFRDKIDSEALKAFDIIDKPLVFQLGLLGTLQNSAAPGASHLRKIYTAYIHWFNTNVIKASKNIEPAKLQDMHAAAANTSTTYCDYVKQLSTAYNAELHKELDILLRDTFNRDKDLYDYMEIHFTEGAPPARLPSGWETPGDLWKGRAGIVEADIPVLPAGWGYKDLIDPPKQAYSSVKLQSVTLSEMGSKLYNYVLENDPVLNADNQTKLDIVPIFYSDIYRKVEGEKLVSKRTPLGAIAQYYPSTPFVKALCDRSSAGLKDIMIKQHASSGIQTELDWLSGADEGHAGHNMSAYNSPTYDEDTGLCNYTRNYCENKMSIDYAECCSGSTSGSCDTTSHPPADCSREQRDGVLMFNDCDESYAQEAAEFLVGKTVTRGFLNGWNEVFGDGAAECETYDEEEEKAQH